ncbi:MAG TPA: septum formation initiator family protein [Patescibacteria group bacterium]|nr:septum formation initiator family protein [Patescibacteria group bacterium]
MASRGGKSIGGRLLSSRTLFFISLFILIFFSFNLAKELINRKDLQNDIDKLQSEMDGLAGKNTELTSLIDYFKSLDFVENEARTKLNLRKPGEKIIIVPEAGETPGLQAKAQKLSLENNGEGNPQKWWNYFFENQY